MSELVLSLFPGADLLGLAFAQEWPGACIVRGPDPLYGSLHDARTFHPPAGVFAGIVGGPPCQPFSVLGQMFARGGGAARHDNLIPEYERIVLEAQPDWFVMEEVRAAPVPVVEGYLVHSALLNNRWLTVAEDGVGAAQSRTRRISFGTRDGRPLVLDVAVFTSPTFEQAVTKDARPVIVKIGGSGKPKATLGKPRRTVADACRLQGLPGDFLDESPFTESAKREIVANGVPLMLGRAIARAVRRAMSAPGCATPHQDAAG